MARSSARLGLPEPGEELAIRREIVGRLGPNARSRRGARALRSGDWPGAGCGSWVPHRFPRGTRHGRRAAGRLRSLAVASPFRPGLQGGVAILDQLLVGVGNAHHRVVPILAGVLRTQELRLEVAVPADLDQALLEPERGSGGNQA